MFAATQAFSSSASMSLTTKKFSPFSVRAFTETSSRVESRPQQVQNLYQVLNLKPSATARDIKTAYRSLAKRFHPDVAKEESNSDDFMEIHNAYSVLSDPTAKARYDMSMGGGNGVQRVRYATVGGSDCVGYKGSRTSTRRWETDQCW